jgi:hypothetical protein
MMDLEQLKLVLEAVNSVGGEAKEFGFWWLACSVIPSVLWFTFGVAALILATRAIHESVRAYSAAREMADALGHDWMGFWESSDTIKCVRKIRELREKTSEVA